MDRNMDMALSLEHFLIGKAHWNNDRSWRAKAPKDVVEELDGTVPPSGSVGLGKHPKLGWFVLGCGQGPFVIWSEWDHEGWQEY